MSHTFTRVSAKVGITAGALLAAGVMLAASASAATTYTVKVGSTTTGKPAVTGKTTALPSGGQQIQFVDTTSNLALGCDSGSATGKANLGTAISGKKVGSISSTKWKNCTGPGGIALTPKQSGTWTIAATGPTSNGVTPAAVNAVVAKVTGTGCTFTVTGAATGVYDNATQLLKLAPVANPTSAQKLTTSAVSGCFGVINNGDNVTFTANYKLTVPSLTGTLSVTSN